MSLSRTSRTIVISAATLVTWVQEATAQKIYWADAGTGKIQRSDLNGANIQDVVTGLPQPAGVAIDNLEEHVYWTDVTANKISRADLNGANVQDVTPSGPANPQEICIDQLASRILWTSGAFPGSVQHANFSGAGEESIGITGLFPDGVTLATYDRQVYWIDRAAKRIHRVQVDGTGAEVFLVLPTNSDPRHLTINVASQEIFWTDTNTGNGKLTRASIHDAIPHDVVTGQHIVVGIAVDPVNKKIYWTDTLDNTIRRANLDGSNIEDVVSVGLDTPMAIDLWLPADCDTDGVIDAVDVCPCTTSPAGTDVGGRPIGDTDDDCDVDLLDFWSFQLNLSGPL